MIARCARVARAAPRVTLGVALACSTACAAIARAVGGFGWDATTPREWVLARDGTTATADAAEAAMAIGARCGDAM